MYMTTHKIFLDTVYYFGYDFRTIKNDPHNRIFQWKGGNCVKISTNAVDLTLGQPKLK